ncbi:hypothetical protein DPMN_151328 [Dreissena polymorpha]|uniref:Uncharacterized protein n=1 Tax=Dreissena polymorpha TaxID=45954 RepID=A0A9D4FG92_DREPO|nr:hypothetical protein DPMN_151328 [Dreissena polymorpha]
MNLCGQATALSNLFQSEKWLVKSSIFVPVNDAVVLITTSCLTSESSSAISAKSFHCALGTLVLQARSSNC